MARNYQFTRIYNKILRIDTQNAINFIV